MTHVTKHYGVRLSAILPALIMCMILFGVAHVAAAPLWHHVTVISTEGWRYDDVSVVLTDNADSLIVHHADSSKTVMALTAIAAIRNYRDEDITQYVYDPAVRNTERFTPMPPPPPVVKEDFPDQIGKRPLPRPVEGRRFSGAFSIHGGYNFAAGNFFSNRKGGLALTLAYRKRTGGRPYWGVMYIYQRIDSRRGSSGSGWPYFTPPRSEADYGQHEFYANLGIHSRPATYSGSFFLWEFGVGLMSFDGGMSEGTTIALRLAAMFAKPLGRNASLVFEFSTRASRQGSDGRGDAGVLAGASVGLMFTGGS